MLRNSADDDARSIRLKGVAQRLIWCSCSRRSPHCVCRALSGTSFSGAQAQGASLKSPAIFAKLQHYLGQRSCLVIERGPNVPGAPLMSGRCAGRGSSPAPSRSPFPLDQQAASRGIAGARRSKPNHPAAGRRARRRTAALEPPIWCAPGCHARSDRFIASEGMP